MDFDEKKRRTMEKLKEAMERGEVDKPIIPLLEEINKKKDYFTTSSCSGRVILLAEGEKKKDSEKYWRKHELVKEKEIEEAIKNYKGDKRLYLKVEPLILHVIARDLESSNKFIRKMREAGIKRIGMQKAKAGFLIEMLGTEFLSIPLWICKCDRSIVKLINEKLSKNFKRLERVLEKAKEL